MRSSSDVNSLMSMKSLTRLGTRWVSPDFGDSERLRPPVPWRVKNLIPLRQRPIDCPFPLRGGLPGFGDQLPGHMGSGIDVEMPSLMIHVQIVRIEHRHV